MLSPRGQNFVLGLGLEDLSSACPRTFYFGLMKNVCNAGIGNFDSQCMTTVQRCDSNYFL